MYSFVKYNYPEDGINWAYPGELAESKDDDEYINIINNDEYANVMSMITMQWDEMSMIR